MNFSVERLFAAAYKRLTKAPAPDLIFMSLALVAASWGLSKVIRGFPSNTAVLASLTGVGLGWWAASRPKKRWPGGVLLLAAGIFLFFIHAGDLTGILWRSVTGVFQLSYAAGQEYIVQTFWEYPPPPQTIEIPPEWGNLASGLELVWGRFTNWLSLFVQRRSFYDQAAVSIWWSGTIWLCAWWAGILFRRLGSGLTACAPAGILLIALLNRSASDARLLLPFCGAVLALLSSSTYFNARERWAVRKLDLPDTLGLDTSVWSGAILAIVIVTGFATAALPAINIETLRELTANLRPEGSTGQPEADALGVQPANRLEPPPNRVGGASLPRQHLIGASPELSEQIALTAKILSDSGLPPEAVSPAPERYYLRGLAYDVYLGAGWGSSPFARRVIESGMPIQTPDEQEIGRREIEQEINMTPDHKGMVLVVGDALAVNRAVEATWRAAPSGTIDLFGLGVAEETYSAWSSQSQASAEALRDASQDYPNWVRERYLQLPDNIPTRVISLAATFTHIPNSYDTATAIESYLRTYTYTLDIPQPPIGQDIVEHFLFDLKQGYCDYYASAMVVLARLNGLPSRLVIGYVASEYDPASQSYIVREKSAHSWVEVYFPNFGWIPFEPTASYSSIRRSNIALLPSNAANPEITAPNWLRDGAKSWRDWGVLAAGLGILAVLVFIQLYPFLDRWWTNKDGKEQAITRLYRRFERYARQTVGALPTGATPFELDSELSAQLSQVKWPLHKASANVKTASAELTSLYVETAYSPKQPNMDELNRAWQLWGKIKRSWRILGLFKPFQQKPANRMRKRKRQAGEREITGAGKHNERSNR